MRVYPQYWMVYNGKSKNKMDSMDDDWGYPHDFGNLHIYTWG